MATANDKRLILRNPLTVYGLVLLAGDGPLVILYSLSKDGQQQWISLLATILFIFGMGIFFGYLVVSKPRHLFAPDQIPKEAYETSIYKEKLKDKVLIEAQELVNDIRQTENPEVRTKLTETLNVHLDIAQDFQTAYELLLVPGYDISLIRDILDFVEIHKYIDYDTLSEPRKITSATIINIEKSMFDEKLITRKGKNMYLTNKGIKLRNGLQNYSNNKR